MGLPEIVAVTMAGNLRSRAVMRRIGMTSDPAEDFDDPDVRSHQGPEGTGGNTDLETHRVNISRSLGDTHSESAEAPPGGTNEDRGSVTRRDSRDRTQLMRSAAGWQGKRRS